MKLLSTADAAEKLNISVRRVQELIASGRLPAQTIGGTYVINEDDLVLVKDRKPGRPPKVKTEADEIDSFFPKTSKAEAKQAKSKGMKKGNNK